MKLMKLSLVVALLAVTVSAATKPAKKEKGDEKDPYGRTGMYAKLPVNGTNLVLNAEFKQGLKGWQITWPETEMYRDNHKFLKAGTDQGRPCVLIDAPGSILGNQGVRILTPFIKTEPGATYVVAVDCLQGSCGFKVHAEAFVTDPRTNPPPDPDTFPAKDGLPPLLRCYRWKFPIQRAPKNWETVSREITVPQTIEISVPKPGSGTGMDGKRADYSFKLVPPEYMAIRCVAISGGKDGHGAWTNFRIYKIKSE